MKSLLKGLVLKHRFLTLMLMAGYGLLLVYAAAQCGDCLLALLGMDKMDGASEKFLSSFYVIVLGLPTLAMLWFFRTHDTHEQIQKTKESIEASVLFGALNMLFDNSSADRASIKNVAGLAMLINLRQQDLHQSTIDLATRKANLVGADLSNVDLREANLSDADLENANLQNANLQGADLAEANLRGTDLRNSDLRGTDLQRAKYIWDVFPNPQNKRTVFTGALYSDDTQFPKGIDPEKDEYDMKKID